MDTNIITVGAYKHGLHGSLDPTGGVAGVTSAELTAQQRPRTAWRRFKETIKRKIGFVKPLAFEPHTLTEVVVFSDVALQVVENRLDCMDSDTPGLSYSEMLESLSYLCRGLAHTDKKGEQQQQVGRNSLSVEVIKWTRFLLFHQCRKVLPPELKLDLPNFPKQSQSPYLAPEDKNVLEARSYVLSQFAKDLRYMEGGIGFLRNPLNQTQAIADLGCGVLEYVLQKIDSSETSVPSAAPKISEIKSMGWIPLRKYVRAPKSGEPNEAEELYRTNFLRSVLHFLDVRFKKESRIEEARALALMALAQITVQIDFMAYAILPDSEVRNRLWNDSVCEIFDQSNKNAWEALERNRDQWMKRLDPMALKGLDGDVLDIVMSHNLFEAGREMCVGGSEMDRKLAVFWLELRGLNEIDLYDQVERLLGRISVVSPDERLEWRFELGRKISASYLLGHRRVIRHIESILYSVPQIFTKIEEAVGLMLIEIGSILPILDAMPSSLTTPTHAVIEGYRKLYGQVFIERPPVVPETAAVLEKWRNTLEKRRPAMIKKVYGSITDRSEYARSVADDMFNDMNAFLTQKRQLILQLTRILLELHHLLKHEKTTKERWKGIERYVLAVENFKTICVEWNTWTGSMPSGYFSDQPVAAEPMKLPNTPIQELLHQGLKDSCQLIIALLNALHETI